jgi:dipeptidyl aminopeptidase/acylaminoacyl peptidase
MGRSRGTAARFVKLAIGIGLLCAASAPLQAAAVESPSVAALGHLPSLENLALSPDGTRLIYIQTEGDQRNMYIRSLADGSLLAAASVGDTKLRSLSWLDNDNILIERSSTSPPPPGFIGKESEFFELATFSLSKKRLFGLTFDMPGKLSFNIIDGSPMLREVGGKAALYVPGVFVSDRFLPALFKLDVASSTIRPVIKGSYRDTEWLLDDSGNIAGDFFYRDDLKTWELQLGGVGTMHTVAGGSAPLDIPDVIGFNASGDSIVVGFVEDGEPVWKPMALKDGSWGAPLANGEHFTGPIVDRKTGRIIGATRGIDDSHYTFFDNELQSHWNAVLRAYPNERVELLSHSDDYSRLLLRIFGPKDGYVYALFDWYTHKAATLGKVYKGVDAVAEVRSITYPAADGLEISGYLTLPRGRAEKGLPLVVLPHGGPAAADAERFDWWAQALAAEGYAVIQPNYRGSAVTEKLEAAGYGEWGRKMQTDLSDAVRYLAKDGTIDPKRVCIVGGSYGGYAALAGVTLDPGVYRCAVSVAGLSDLKRFLLWSGELQRNRDNFGQRYWDRFMGISGPNDPALQAISPIEHASAVSAPVLLIHGRDDTVVPFQQSDVMADALRHAGKQVEVVTLRHEDHWLSRSDTRYQMLAATVAFLKENNPPD